jgi:outer membrane protein TolC
MRNRVRYPYQASCTILACLLMVGLATAQKSGSGVGGAVLPTPMPGTNTTPSTKPTPETKNTESKSPAAVTNSLTVSSTGVWHETPPLTIGEAVLLAHGQAIDSIIADRQVELTQAQLDRAKVLWMPNISFGMDYLYHTGAFQNFAGEILHNNRRSLMYGAGINAVFSLADATMAPRAATQDLNARVRQRFAIRNDLALSVMEAYFTVLQFQGEAQTATELARDAEELVRRVEALAEGLAPGFEANRARLEQSRRKLAATLARERYAFAHAELCRLLRLDPRIQLTLAETPSTKQQVIDSQCKIDDLIPIALATRPELSAHQALVQATLERLRQEKLRPLVPSVLVRSISTNPSGSLGVGSFGGGPGGIRDMGGRFDYDVQILWELQNLGFGNRARVRERETEQRLALLELFRTQDRIAAEVTQAYAALVAAVEKMQAAEPAFKDARELLAANLEGMTQTKRVGNLITLIVRPQETVASFQAAGTATTDYYAAIADYNRAQYRLYRALGRKAGEPLRISIDTHIVRCSIPDSTPKPVLATLPEALG